MSRVVRAVRAVKTVANVVTVAVAMIVADAAMLAAALLPATKPKNTNSGPLGQVRFSLDDEQAQALYLDVLLIGKPLHTFPEAS